MDYGITPGRTLPRAKSRNWAARHKFANVTPQPIDRDKPGKSVSSRFAPELVQAAKALGVHPAQLETALKTERSIRRLADKFNR